MEHIYKEVRRSFVPESPCYSAHYLASSLYSHLSLHCKIRTMASVSELQQGFVPPTFQVCVLSIDIIIRLIETYMITSACGMFHFQFGWVSWFPTDIGPLVLFLYESTITLGREVDVVWGRRWTAITWLYAFMRYSTIALNTMVFNPAASMMVWHSQIIQMWYAF